jgi:hypothetical protein
MHWISSVNLARVKISGLTGQTQSALLCTLLATVSYQVDEAVIEIVSSDECAVCRVVGIGKFYVGCLLLYLRLTDACSGKDLEVGF